MRLGLYQRKNNFGREKTLGRRLKIEGQENRLPDVITVSQADVADDPELSRKSGLQTLILNTMLEANSPVTTETILVSVNDAGGRATYKGVGASVGPIGRAGPYRASYRRDGPRACRDLGIAGTGRPWIKVPKKSPQGVWMGTFRTEGLQIRLRKSPCQSPHAGELCTQRD